MTPYRVAVVGCAGRMGRMNLAAIHAAEGCVIAGGSDQPGNPMVGSDIGLLIGQGPLGGSEVRLFLGLLLEAGDLELVDLGGMLASALVHRRQLGFGDHVDAEHAGFAEVRQRVLG